MKSKANDSLKNVTSGMGTERDKASLSAYAAPTITINECVNAYRSSWLARKIIDIPAVDAFSRWREWQATAEQITLIENEEKRLGYRDKILEVAKAARLVGGGALFIGTGETDLAAPLDTVRITKGGLRYINIIEREELNVVDYENDVLSEFFHKPKMYRMGGSSVEIHPSRLVIIQGNTIPNFVMRQTMAGWGESILVNVMRAIKDSDNTSSNIASLVFEASVDVITVPDLMENLKTTSYSTRLIERFGLAALAKGINRILMLDGDEGYEKKTQSFAQLPEVMQAFMQLASAAADVPATRLMAQSPAGMSSTGESDLVNYYDRIKGDQETVYSPAMQNLDDAVVQSALGSNPPEVYYRWSSLWQLSDNQKAEIGKKHAETGRIWSDSGLIPAETLSTAIINQQTETGFYPGLDQECLPEDYDFGTGNDTPPTVTDALPRSLYVHRKVLNGAEIVKWAEDQGFKIILEPDDIHVTVLYSRNPVDWMKIGEPWRDKMTISEGGARLVEKLGDDAVVLLFKSDELEWQHESMIESGASHDYAEYQPHITITYGGNVDLDSVEPYQGVIELGPEIFQEIDTA